MATKTLKYYLDLDYDVIISRRESEGLVSYKAYARELDPFVFYGAGDTKEEALGSFEETKRELFKIYLSEGRTITEPVRETSSLPSGKFLMRTSPRNHYRLAEMAKNAGKSLNSYVDQVLTYHVAQSDLLTVLHQYWPPMQKLNLRIRSVKIELSQAQETESISDYAAGGYSCEPVAYFPSQKAS